MVDDIGQLLGEQTNIESVQDATSARCSKIQLKVSSGIPGESCNATVARYTELVKNSSDLARALSPLRVRCALKASTSGSHDGLVAEILFGSIEQVQDAQRHFLHESRNDGCA